MKVLTRHNPKKVLGYIWSTTASRWSVSEKNIPEYTKMDMEAARKTCQQTALSCGHTIKEADGCDNGSVGCKTCPFNT